MKLLPKPDPELMDSFAVLFEKITPDGKMLELRSSSQMEFLKALSLVLQKSSETQTNRPDVTDALNMLAETLGRRSFRERFDDAVFEALTRINLPFAFQKELLKNADSTMTVTGHSLFHAVHLTGSMEKLFASWREKAKGTPGRLSPAAADFNLENSLFLHAKPKGLVLELAEYFRKQDLFADGRAFRYLHDTIVPAELKSIRPLKDFYGYNEVKRVFAEHFDSFIKGKHNLPLLISGLPGLGKTQMTIAHLLARKGVLLVLGDPAALQQGLEKLISLLAARPDHKFVIFFDDVDTRNVDWYYFRTHIGGTFALPSNILVVIASNYKFPPNISSRGRAVTFPLFDELRCMEMIEDLLKSRGMKEISQELLFVIAADYVEIFGQNVFEELSPRTLARYLELYLSDGEKRRRLLDYSKGELITKPDPEAFYAQNIKLLRALYGEEAIDEIRERELSGK